MRLDVRESDFNVVNERYCDRRVSVYCDEDGYMLLLKLEESLLAKNHLDNATLDLFKLLSSAKWVNYD